MKGPRKDVRMFYRSRDAWYIVFQGHWNQLWPHSGRPEFQATGGADSKEAPTGSKKRVNKTDCTTPIPNKQGDLVVKFVTWEEACMVIMMLRSILSSLGKHIIFVLPRRGFGLDTR